MSMIDRYLPMGMTIEVLLTYFIGLITFLSVYAIWRSLTQREPREARQRMIARRREELEVARSSARRHRAHRAPSPLARLGQLLRLVQATQAEKIRGRLLRAGIRSREAVPAFLVVKLALPISLSTLAFLLLFLVQLVAVGPTWRPLFLLLAGLLGFILPDLYLRNLQGKRRVALQKALPDGLDLLVICAEAGLSLDAALNRVAEEIGASSPELGDELALTAVELNFLPDRRQALLNLGQRCALPAISGVVNTLLQTEKYGTPLSQSLRVLSGEYREQRMLRAEEKASRLPAILTVPMIVFILPTLFIVLIGPAMIDVFDNLLRK